MGEGSKRIGVSFGKKRNITYFGIELPRVLKSCFLCLGFFKEDSIIRVSKLVNLWIAQGLILQEGMEGQEKITMEEIATSYLDELINRNMVQVKKMSTSEKVKMCYVHDLLHELSIKKAKEEISFEILREGNSQSSDKALHRAVYYSAERSVFGNSNMRLRTLFIRGVGIAVGKALDDFVYLTLKILS
ncbi:UNVERIFIED_CONTAM: Disease resistance protein RPP13 [Sesamum radiatum]|uniref:Disease resistance protein RPP13 n=1 Tax=Sesamum radiatum TaxID=300843 RepID=A0AAW2K9F7_SESRA